MINIDIKGSCITREAFNYSTDYKINNYWFQKPLVTMVSEPLPKDSDLYNEIELSLLNRNQKMFMIKKVKQTLNKDFFLNYKKADYFILDLIDERLNLSIINEKTYIEYEKNLNEILAKKFKVEVVFNDFEIWKKSCDKFFSKLLNFYKEEEIILHKGYALNNCMINGVEYTLNDLSLENSQFTIDAQNKYNELYRKCYDYIISKYPNIKIIELEIDKYGSDPDHRLLKSLYHYEKKYYLDFLKMLKNIVNGSYSKELVDRISIINNRILNQNLINQKNLKIYNKKMDYLKNSIVNTLEKSIENISSLDNLKEVKEKIYRYPNGKINIYEKYIDSNIVEKKIYNINGNLKEVFNFQNGRLTEQIEYYKNFIAFRYKYNDKGLLNSFIEYYHNGKIKIEILYGEFAVIGQPYSETKYDIEGRKISFFRFFSTGEKYAENVYLNGITQKCIYYSKDGYIISEKEIKNNRGSRILDYYEESNIVFKETEFFDNAMQKSIKKFNKNGDLIYYLKRDSINEKYTKLI